MPRPTTGQPTAKPASRRCNVEGCRAYAVHGRDLCNIHAGVRERLLAQGKEPVIVHGRYKKRTCKEPGCDAEPPPHKDYCSDHSSRKQTRCAFRGCQTYAQLGDHYCGPHRRYADGLSASERVQVADQIEAMLARVQAHQGIPKEILQTEMDLVMAVRAIFLQGAQDLTVKGWHGMSPGSFTRTWLATTSTVLELAKAQWVMDRADNGGFDGLLKSVYDRLESAERDAIAAGDDGPLAMPRVASMGASADPDPADAQLALPMVIPHNAMADLRSWAETAVRFLGREGAHAAADAYIQENDVPADQRAMLRQAIDAQPDQEPPMASHPALLARLATGLARVLE